tara:strand:+ start:1856 stop:2689 length:834 start_codon:yes stop_codon:yes gene_type:complete
MKIIIFKTFCIFIFFSIALTNWDGAFTYKTSLKTKLGTFEAGEKNINIKYLVNDYTPPHAILTSKSIITNSFINKFYSVEDSVSLLMFPDMSLIHHYKSIKENKKPLKIYSTKLFKDTLVYNKLVNDEKKIKYYPRIERPIFDPLGIIFSFINKDIDKNNEFKFLSYSKGKTRSIVLQLIGEEIIDSPHGKKKCIILSSNSSNNKKNKGDIKIWVSSENDILIPKHTPLKIQTHIKSGILTMILDSLLYYPEVDLNNINSYPILFKQLLNNPSEFNE